MDQHFNGPIGQVAGNDIHNHGAVTWDQLPTEELHHYRKHYRSLLWAARRRLFFNLPNLVLAITMLGFSTYMLYLLTQFGIGHLGRTLNELPSWAFFGYAIFGIVLPAYFVMRTKEREGAIIYDCRANLRGIDITLNSRC